MRILEIRERTFPIASPIRNAYIDFGKMTLSLVAVVTDVVREGKRVVGYGFNSNGRYGQGTLMRERFIPRVMDKPMATGENAFSMQDARNLIRYGGLRADRDWLQFDCALSYRLVEYLRTLAMLREHGWSSARCIPHGGHQMSLNIAAGLGLGGNESYPDLFQPFGGFPDGVRVENGYVTMPELPGIGFEGKSDLYGLMRELSA
jgi:hypothetical protein